MRILVFIAIFMLALAVPCFAQDINEPKKESDGLNVDFSFGYHFLNGPGASADFFTLAASIEFSMSDWAVGFNVPLMLQSKDLKITERAYDETSDFIQFLEYLRFGYKNKTDVYFRVGSLYGEAAKLGHGSIIADYYSDIDFDSPQNGFQFDWDHKHWGFETIVNSVCELNLLGARVYFRPFQRAKSDFNKDITIGVSLVTDIHAPVKIKRDEDNNPAFDSEFNLKYTEKVINFVGFDVATPLIAGSWFKISPYFDYVFMLNYGSGFHFGLRQEYNLPILGDILPIDVSLEYRNLASDYLPVYFDGFYEIERFNYPLTISHSSKLSFIPNTEHSSGFYGNLKWGIKDLFWMRGSFSYYTNDPLELKSSVFIEAATETLVEFKFMYAQRNITQFNEILERNEKSTIYVRASMPIELNGSNLIVGFSFQRSWRLSETTGYYVPIDDFMPFISYKLDF